MRFILTRFNRDAVNEYVPVEELSYEDQSLSHMVQRMANTYGHSRTVITKVDDTNNRINFFVADQQLFANSVFEVSLDG